MNNDVHTIDVMGGDDGLNCVPKDAMVDGNDAVVWRNNTLGEIEFDFADSPFVVPPPAPHRFTAPAGDFTVMIVVRRGLQVGKRFSPSSKGRLNGKEVSFNGDIIIRNS